MIDWSARRAHLSGIYDGYYASREYQRRYPRPNPGTLDFLLRHAGQARRVADIGCGNGRYALPLLEAGPARLVGCDTSGAALAAFGQRLQGHPAQARVTLVHGDAAALPLERFDCLLMLFGVLGHVGSRQERVECLRQLRRRATPQACLLLSVPSRWRRRPLDLARSLFTPGREAFGDIEFRRRIGQREQTFFYHLYTPRELRAELAEAGWSVIALEAESLLPEWLLSQHGWLGRLDRRLQPWIPPALGYGIRAAARAATPSVQTSVRLGKG